MQFINKHMRGRQEVGHIDLMQRQSYIEVPADDAKKVMRALDGTVYKGRRVRCNDADSRLTTKGERKDRGRGEGRYKGDAKAKADSRKKPSKARYDKEDWRKLIAGKPFKLKGDEPDFSEEGWARRRPKKG